MFMDGEIPGISAFRRSIHPITEGNKLHHNLVGGLNATGVWKHNADINWSRNFIRDKIAEQLASLGWGHESFGFVTELESKLFKDAASKEDYMNLGTLKHRLCKILEENLNHQVLCPSSFNHMTTPNWNLALNCSSNTPDFSLNLLMDSMTNYDMALVHPTNQSGYPSGAAGMFAGSDGQNAFLLSDVAHANSQMIFTPEQTSIFSAYHGGEGYHHQALENGTFFAGGNALHHLDAPLNDHFQPQHLKDVFSGVPYSNKQSSQDIQLVDHEVSGLLPYEDFSTQQQLELQQSQQQPHQQCVQSTWLSDAETQTASKERQFYPEEPLQQNRCMDFSETGSTFLQQSQSQIKDLQQNQQCVQSTWLSDAETQTASKKRQFYPEEPLQQNCCMDFSETGSTFLQQSQSQIKDLQQNQQWLHQEHSQLDNLCDAKLKSFLVGEDGPCGTMVAKSASKLPQLSSAEPLNLKDVLPLSAKHKVLRAYTQYRESFREIKGCPESFLKYMHSRICSQMCKCYNVSSLLSHYNACSRGGCDICEPVWYQSITDKGNQEPENVKGSFAKKFRNDNSSDKCNSYCSESMLPPSKRFKMTAPSLLSEEEELSRFLNLIEVQSHNFEFLPRLSSPLSPVCAGSEMVGINMELLSRPIDEHESAKEMGNASAETLFVSTPDSFPEPIEGVVSNCRLEEDLTSDIAEDVTGSCNRLKFDGSPDLSKEDGSEIRNEGVVSDSEPEDSDLRMASDPAEGILDYCYQSKPKALPALPVEDGAGFELKESGVTAKFNKATLNPVNKLMARGSYSRKEIKLESSKIMGLSLTETFTAEQIKDHMSSLKICIDQSVSKKERGSRIVNVVTENGCQLCGAENLALAPAPLYCSFCNARIKRNVMYYIPSEENVPRYCFCSTCHRLSCGTIRVFGNTISKGKLIRRKNDAEVDEPWVQCDKCEGWQHQICALFNVKNNIQEAARYVCLKCCLEEIQNGERLPLTASSVFGAKDLPCTKLSEHIEQRLFRRLQQEREETAKAKGKSINEVPEARDLVVREVLSVDKHVKVKQQFLDIFNSQNYPAEFPCKSKVILLFQKIEGVDVCLFAMYVQEFGSECSRPNQRSVYISYLDSIKYFRPERETATGEALRTFVYHEILMGYLEYCKKRGFSACYLWACPPVKGEDYILYCHPDIQKTPKPDKLRNWYHSMLRKAIKDNVVVEFTNLYDHFLVPSGQSNFKISAAQLPYFDGEYWSVAAEKAIKSMEVEDSGGPCSKLKKALTKNTLKAMGRSSGDCKDVRLLQKLKQTILPKKEEFVVVHLQFICKCCHEAILSGWRWSCSRCKNFQLCERCCNLEQNSNHTHTLSSGEKHSLDKVRVDDVPLDTDDKDIILDNSLFENRHTFLGLCQVNSYQFDTLRRAKHSSMMILHYLYAAEPIGLAATS